MGHRARRESRPGRLRFRIHTSYSGRERSIVLKVECKTSVWLRAQVTRFSLCPQRPLPFLLPYIFSTLRTHGPRALLKMSRVPGREKCNSPVIYRGYHGRSPSLLTPGRRGSLDAVARHTSPPFLSGRQA